MSFCHTCSKNFGFFNKEFGCSKCHELNCKVCLLKGEDKKWICLKCSKNKVDQSTKSNEKKFEDFEKLLLSNENVDLIPALEPLPSSSTHHTFKCNKEKEASNNNIDDDIAKRLAALKGLDKVEIQSNKKKEFEPDTRCDAEKVNDLIDEATNFVKIQTFPADQLNKDNGIQEIEKRLAELRGISFTPNVPTTAGGEDFDEERDTYRIIQQCLDEVKLEDVVGDLESSEKPENKISNENELKELPFCEICNEDAEIRCIDCENLFCSRCFREFHDEEEYREHSTKPYKHITNSKE